MYYFILHHNKEQVLAVSDISLSYSLMFLYNIKTDIKVYDDNLKAKHPLDIFQSY